MITTIDSLNSDKWTTHLSDVLVIGGGISGLWTAIKARENKGTSVTLVDKGYFGSTSHSFFSGGGMVALLPEDDLAEWVEDIYKANEGIADKTIIRSILKNSFARLKDYESMGVNFPQENGTYKRIRSRGAKIVKLFGSAKGGGRALVLSLHKKALENHVKIKNRIFIIDIILNDEGQIGGAFGVDIDSFEFHLFRAKITVLATNSGSFRGHHLASDQQGTGVFLALSCGAELKNAEFHYINVRPSRFEIEGSGILPKFGARWINANNEYFMGKYDTDLKDHAPNHLILTSMAKEALAGNAPLCFDTPSLAEEGRLGFREMMMGHGWMRLLYDKLKHDGLDILRDKIEWNAAYETNRIGINTDHAGKVLGVENLYAAGMARAFIPNTLTGFSIAYCTWSGYITGETVAQKVKMLDMPEVNINKILSLKDKFIKPLKANGDVTADDVVERLQNILFPANVLILISHENLKKALDDLVYMKQGLALKMSGDSLHELIKIRETETMLVSAELTLRASMLRKESRPFIFYREDFDKADNEWLRWIVVREKDNNYIFDAQPIPKD